MKFANNLNEVEVCELLEKAVDFIRNNGMVNEWLEEYDLDPSEDARERFTIYEEDDEELCLEDLLSDDDILSDDEELMSELKEFDCEFEFEDF